MKVTTEFARYSINVLYFLYVKYLDSNNIFCHIFSDLAV